MLPSGRDPPPLAPIATAIALSAILGPRYFVDATAPGALAAAVGWAALLGPLLAPGMGPRGRLACAAACGTSGALLWVAWPEQWVHVCLAAACRLVLVPFTLAELLALGAATAVPLGLIAATLLGGMTDASRVLLRGVALAVPAPRVLAAHGASISCALWVAARSGRASDGASSRQGVRSAVAVGVAMAALALELGLRGRATLAEVLLPTDANQWSEAPMLMNVVKLREGIPLYGPPGDVRSYTYSPTFELLQAALLAPFGLSLRIVAHRVLVLGWELCAAAIFAWAMAPVLGGTTRAERGARAAVVMAAALALEWASPASPFLHPDHAVHVVVALAVGLLVRWDGLSPRLVRVGAALLPPAAVLFKLTGAGVGVGLALVALRERRRDLLGALALAAALAAATIPLYDALFGRFSEYAVVLMAHHAVNWGNLGDLARLPEGRLALSAGALALGTLGSPPGGESRSAARLALFMIGLGALTLLAALKEGGRANNLVAPALPALAVALLVLARSGGAAALGELACVAALSAVTPDFGPALDRARGEHAIADARAAIALVRGELARGRHPLVHSGTTLWLDAGGRGVPRDLLHPAIELYMGGHPAFDDHLARLASGMYETLVTPGQTFVVQTTRGDPFGERMQRAVSPRYCVVYPLDAHGAPVPITYGERLLLLRRRDLGCAPLDPARAATE